jgi:Fe-S cluster assembly protein SufD
MSLEDLQKERKKALEIFEKGPIPPKWDDHFKFSKNVFAREWFIQPAWSGSVSSDSKNSSMSKDLSESLNLKEGEAKLLQAATEGENCETKSFGETSEGVLFGRAEDIWDRLPEKFRTRAGLPKRLQSDRWAALATAKWSSGHVLYVPEGVKAEKTYRLIQWLRFQQNALYHRTWILLDRGSEACFIEEFLGEENASEENSSFKNKGPKNQDQQSVGLLQVHLEEGAKLKLIHNQNWSDQTSYLLRCQLSLGKDSQLFFHPMSSGGKQGQVRLNTDFEGPGAYYELFGGVRGDDQQHFDLWSHVNHGTADCESYQGFRCVMAGQSKTVFNGNIRVTQEGLKTKAHMKNQNMLLSNTAHVNTLPKLEIETDDLECSHGASVASLDEDHLFYLQSRGIPFEEAQKMVIDGFTEEFIQKIPQTDLQNRIREQFNKKEGLK